MIKKLLTVAGIVLLGLTFLPAVIVLIVARIMGNKKWGDIAECILWWNLIPFVLPFRAKKLGVISKQIYAWLLVLASPLACIIYVIIALIITYTDYYTSITPKTIHFKTKNDIAALTDIAEFPEIKHLSSSHDSWGHQWTEHMFQDTNSVDGLIREIELKIDSKENVYWRKDTVQRQEDKEFFGGEYVYVMERAWDSIYTEMPRGTGLEHANVKVVVGKKALTIKEMPCGWSNLEYYSNRDSLSALCGVAFPEYKVVNLLPNNYSIDSGWSATLKLASKPGRTFINAIRKNSQWERTAEGTYHFRMSGRGGRDLWEDIYIDPNSKLVKVNVSTY